MVLCVTAYKDLPSFYPYNPMQNVPVPLGTAPDQDDVPYCRLGIQRFEFHHVTILDERTHAAPRGCQPNPLTPLQGGANDGHQFTGR